MTQGRKHNIIPGDCVLFYDTGEVALVDKIDRYGNIRVAVTYSPSRAGDAVFLWNDNGLDVIIAPRIGRICTEQERTSFFNLARKYADLDLGHGYFRKEYLKRIDDIYNGI